jgi:small-conductance mechanosensitive channel
MGVRGTVLSIGSHTTVLRTVDGVRSHIPNTSLLGETVNVDTAFETRRAEFDLSLAAGPESHERSVGGV